MRNGKALCAIVLALASAPAVGAPGGGSSRGRFNMHAALHAGDSDAQSGADEKTQQTTIIYNLTAGWVFDMGIFAGAKAYRDRRYTDVSEPLSTTETTTISRATTTSGYGFTVGYYAENGFMLTASLLPIMPEKKAPGVKLSGGHAEIYDIGYRIQWGDYAIGPQVTASKFVFKKQKANGETSSLHGSWYEQSMLPHLAAWVFF